METLEKEKAVAKKAESPTKDGAPRFPEFEGTDTIVLLAKHGDQLPTVLRPCQDKTGRVFTGQGPTGHWETMSEEDKRQSYVITPETSVVLTNERVIDWNNPVDRANWVWMRRHPYIAMSKEQMRSSRDAVFYVQNQVAEATARVQASKIRDKARYVVQYDSNRDSLLRAAKVLGHIGADSLTDTMLQDYLLQQADFPGMAQMVLEAVTTENSELVNSKVLFTELQKYRLVQRGDAGLFRFGGEKGAPLGHTEETVLEFMMDVKNADTVLMMKNALAQRKQQPIQ